MTKATRRLVPFLLLLYVLAFLDRVNVGFAKVAMMADTGLSAAAYALGAGLFFIGYLYDFLTLNEQLSDISNGR